MYLFEIEKLKREKQLIFWLLDINSTDYKLFSTYRWSIAHQLRTVTEKVTFKLNKYLKKQVGQTKWLYWYRIFVKIIKYVESKPSPDEI